MHVRVLTAKHAPESHPAGTTWVFDDGSQVVLKATDDREPGKEQVTDNCNNLHYIFFPTISIMLHSEHKCA
jgi:hypothetical protein